MMEENNDIFFAGGHALVYLAVTMHKKYSVTFVWGINFRTNFTTLLSLVSVCTHLD